MPDPKDPNSPNSPNPDDPSKKEPLKPAAGANDQQPIIDPDRVNQIIETNEQLQTRVSELEKTTNKSQPAMGQQKTWDQVSDTDLEYIVTHPDEFPEHATAAFKEVRKRDREVSRNEAVTQMGTNSFMEQNKEAFDPNTPMGKEVAKIMGQGGNRSQSDVLSDVVELAQYRLGLKEDGKGAQKGRKQVLDNLKAAAAHSPGAEGNTEPVQPSFMDMPKSDFEKEVQKVKMKDFK